MQNQIKEDLQTPITDILNKYNLSMIELSRKLNIPYRTIQDWKAGKRQAPEYVLNLIDKCLEYERKQK